MFARSFVLIAAAVVFTAAAVCPAEPGRTEPYPLPRQKELAEKAGFKIVPAPDAPQGEVPLPECAGEARLAGMVPFVRDYNLPIYPESAVLKAELAETPAITLARGETEPLSLGVQALTDLKGITAKVVPADGEAVEGLKLRIQQLEPAYIRTGGRNAKKAVLTHLRLRPILARGLDKGVNAQYWVTATADEQAKPGEYAYTVVLQAKDHNRLTVPVVVTVRPYTLADPGRWIGAFCAARLVPDVEMARDWKDHGINGMLWSSSKVKWNPRLVDGELKLDLSETEKIIDTLAEAGIDGAVAVAIGNDRRGMLEAELMELYDRKPAKKEKVGRKTAKVARMDDEVINKAYKESIRQFNALVKSKENWPEVAILPYDEPTERLMPEATLRYTQIKEVAPNLPVYGVTMNRLEWAKKLAPISDILVCNGDRRRIAALGEELGKRVWTYAGSPAAIGAGGGRFNMGMRLYQFDLGSHWFWCYDFHPGNPFNEFDSHTGDAQWVVVYPTEEPGRHAVTLTYEGFREAYDDMRYAATVRELLKEKKGGTRDRIAAEFDKLIESIPVGRDVSGLSQEETDPYESLPDYQVLTHLRAKLVMMIETLRKME